MSFAFRPGTGLIVVEAEVSGPKKTAGARLILDTGASISMLKTGLLRTIGYDPDSATDTARLTTGSGSATAPRLVVNRLSALGRHALGLRLVAHGLPDEAAVDGLLGLDFFRDLILTIDFRAGRIDLA